MRRYDEPVEVRRCGPDDAVAGGIGGEAAPAQFLWRDRLWQVRQVVTRWVETGAWWQGAATREVLGDTGSAAGTAVLSRDLLAEREVWRVEAVRGRAAALATLAGCDDADPGLGVFDLIHDQGTGRWHLAGCWD